MQKKNVFRIISVIAILAVILAIVPISTYAAGATKTSDNGVALIKTFEGCRLTAYKPVSTEKYYTIGYGHYGPDVKEGMTITQAQAEKLRESTES